MNKAKVTLPNLFDGEFLAGLEPQEWETLTPAERITARLAFIETRAGVLADLPHSNDSGMPANVHSTARRLQLTAQDALTALEGGDPHTAAWLALEAGKLMADVGKILAVAKALEVTVQLKKPRSAGGRTTAQQKKDEAGANMAEAVRLWDELGRSGKAEHERASIIAQRMGYNARTVRDWLKKAELR